MLGVPMPTPPEYAELHCWSNFSFLEGSSHPEELVEHGRRLGLRGIALTDRDGLYGAVRFAKAAAGTPFAAVCGAELTLETDAPEPIRASCPARPSKEVPTDTPRLVLLAADKTGFGNLARLISTAQLRGRKRDARLRLDDLDGRTDGIIALSGGRNGIVEKALLRRDGEAAVALGARLRDLFPGRFYLELQHHVRPEDPALLRAMVRLAQQLDVPYVATNGVAYATRDDGLLCDVLTCVKYGAPLQTAGTLLRPNHEYHLKTPAQMARLFAEFPLAIRNTLAIAERCAFRLDKLGGEFPLFPIPAEETSAQSYLRTLVYRGARERYAWPLDPKVERQLEYELGIIARMDLAGYFLVVWDISHAAARLGVLAQGRGSAANSAVCYVLGITAIDPISSGLLFERFLSEERGEVPDIDIDFAHQDREKVIQYVYDRYGREHAAMAAEVITYRTRSAIRDVGKALGLTLGQVDQIVREYDARESLAGAVGAPDTRETAMPDSIAKRRDLDAASNVFRSRGADAPAATPGRTLVPSFQDADEDTTLRQAQGDSDASIRGPVGGELGALLVKVCRRVDGFPRHMGIHSGGMVVTRSPLVEVAPIEWATMRDRTIVQWDKDDLSDLGLIKIDLLGLGM
ncbi:MAG: hypothetical protein JWO85_1468, partial [Candidatus Eremiobacteraeota bacterium]|nr:hypothetical protein [Candidatus Eremiobacteraeota bacterium]